MLASWQYYPIKSLFKIACSELTDHKLTSKHQLPQFDFVIPWLNFILKIPFSELGQFEFSKISLFKLGWNSNFVIFAKNHQFQIFVSFPNKHWKHNGRSLLRKCEKILESAYDVVGNKPRKTRNTPF